MEEPCFRVEARVVSFIRDLQLRTHFDQPVDGFAFGRADVRGRNDTQLATRAQVCVERFFECSQAVPFDEGAKEVDAVSGPDLAVDGLTYGRLAARVH